MSPRPLHQGSGKAPASPMTHSLGLADGLSGFRQACCPCVQLPSGAALWSTAPPLPGAQMELHIPREAMEPSQVCILGSPWGKERLWKGWGWMESG